MVSRRVEKAGSQGSERRKYTLKVENNTVTINNYNNYIIILLNCYEEMHKN